MKTNLFILALLCAKVVAAAPDSSRLYFEKGMVEKEAKRYMISHNHFLKAIDFDNKYTEAYMQDGLVALEMRKTDLAISQFSKVVELQPGNSEAIKQLTSLHYSYRHYQKAIDFAKKCVSCDMSNRIIGMSYYQLEDYGQAINFLTIAVKQNPTDGEATYTLGRTYLDIDNYAKAVPYYLSAVKLNPERNSWSYELGLIYYNNKDFRSAAQMFEIAAKNGYNTNNDFKENMGFCLVYAGDYEKGEALIMEVWNRKPGNTDLLRQLADALYKQKQYDRSLVYCQKLMEMNDKDSKALYQAGLCFQKKGEKDRGQQMCDKAIELDPSLQNLRTKKEMMGM